MAVSPFPSSEETEDEEDVEDEMGVEETEETDEGEVEETSLLAAVEELPEEATEDACED
jgi:hypothetical protein